MAVEEINLKISKTPQYINWLENPDNEIPDDVDLLLSEAMPKRDIKSLEWLKRHVLVTLFCADQYSPKKDRFNIDTKEQLENLESQLKTISKFTKLIKKDPDFGIRFFLHACIPMNSPGKVLFNIPEGQYDSILKTMFRDYEKSLQKGISTLSEYQRMSLVAYGGLLFRKIKEDGKLIDVGDIKLNSILFHLTYIFHHFTDNQLDLGTQPKKMPDFGDPRGDLTLQILVTAKIISKGKLKRHHIQNRISRLVKKDVYINPWFISL